MIITETQKGYEVNFSFDHTKLAAVKGIQGSWYRSADKTWIIPKHRQREVEYLMRRFNVPVDPVLDIKEMVADAPEMPELDMELNIPRELYHFQKQGVAYCRINKRVIIGDQPGLGKTSTAIGTVMSYGVNKENMLNLGPGLIICPSTLKLNWQTEWKVVAGRRAMILTDTIKHTWKNYLKVGMVDVFITNYESLKKFFVHHGWKKPSGVDPVTKKERVFRMKDIPFKDDINIFKWVMIDESHKCKDGTTQQSKFVMGITKAKEYIYELTGTPVINKPKDLIAQLTIINRLQEIVSHIPLPLDSKGKPTDLSGYKRFINRYCAGANGESNLKELNYRLTSSCFFRREKTEVLKDLPAKTRQVILCDITNRQEYEKAQNHFVDYLRSVRGCSDEEVRRKLRGEVMVQIGILKQISARGKLEAARDAISEIIDSGQKIVVFVHLKEIAREIKAMFPGAVSITGDDSQEARNNNVNSFQRNPDTKIIVCSLQAGGVGITLTASSEVLFIEFPWTYALCEQAEDRTHRITQEENVRARYLLGEETIDNYCYDLIQKKKTISNTITGASDDVAEEVISQLLDLFNQK